MKSENYTSKKTPPPATSSPYVKTLVLSPMDNARLANLCGQFDSHIQQIEASLGVEINRRSYEFTLIGAPKSTTHAIEVIKQLYQETANTLLLDPKKIHLALQSVKSAREPLPSDIAQFTLKTPELRIKPRTNNQYHYIKNILSHDINFGIGPSGTGKTYLAVAAAVLALEKDEVRRIILIRPAVEAGERLGFLPGNIAEKVDPYLRPLYDALHEMLGAARVAKLLEANVIEIAPLAYMRGRTLNDAFVILDESQNTTKEQMKMFLTRLGFGSKTVITGDITQVDLPHGQLSGLRHATTVLTGISEIHFTFFEAGDVVRHPLVQKVVQAYEQAELKASLSSSPHPDL